MSVINTISPSYYKLQGGFTLLEVLVAVLILAIGLLGLASLQIVGQRANHTAYLRSQAVLQAYDISDRMRANLPGVYPVPPVGECNPASPPVGNYDNISGIPSSPPNCKTTNCQPDAMATYDASEWNTANAALLPSGQGTVTANGDCTFTISISWDDNRDGNVDANDPSFTTTFQP